MTDLKGKSIRGGAVTVAAQGAKFAVQLGSTAILARLLTPADFGLIAMVTALTGFAAMFKDAGLSTATIQRDEITHGQVSVLFWINVALSAVVMLVVAGLAPVLAWFYNEPRLTVITLTLACTFIFSGLTVQHQALLRRQMRFRELGTVDVISLTIGAGTGIAMAFFGCGYWSLVGQVASTTVANCIMVWFCSGWKPGWPVRGSGAMKMVRFGGGLTSFNVLNYFTRNADNVIIGSMLGSQSLGIYAKAYHLLTMPIQQFNAPIASVMLPTLSRLQSDPQRYRRAFLKAIGLLAFIGMPLVAFLFVAADEVVLILLGQGWEQAAPVFRFLAPAALLGTINVAPGWICVSHGRAAIQVKWALLAAPITIASFIIGSRWGISGVAVGFSISWCLMFVVFLLMACHGSPIRFQALALHLSGVVCAAIGAAGLTWIIKYTLLANLSSPIWSILANGVIFALAYLGLSLALPSGRDRIRSLLTDGLAALTPSTGTDKK